MFSVTRLNGHILMLNGDMIKYIESTPDTLISLTTGEKLMVKESVDEVRTRFLNYKKEVAQGPLLKDEL